MSKKDPEYLDELQEWSEHQYDPGHWSGGNIPPHMRGDYIAFSFCCWALSQS